MCLSRPKPPAPPPAPIQPQAYQPEVMDQASLDTRERERRRQVARAGRQSTILTAGFNSSGAGLPPTSGSKTALGS